MKPIAAVAQEAGLVVGAFEAAVADSPADPTYNAIKVLADHSGHTLDGLQLRPHGPPQPTRKELPSPAFALVGVEVHEVVPEQHGTIQRAISSNLFLEDPQVFLSSVLLCL